MKITLSRRWFGLATMSAAAAAASFPGLTLAQSTEFTHAHLLMPPEDLMGRVSAMDSKRPEYEGGGMILVDVRPRSEFDAGHIPGARHLDPNAVVAGMSPVTGSLKSLSGIEALLGQLGVAADRRVVLYDDKGGFHAARMFWLLEYMGHRDVALLDGGWTAWNALNGEVAKTTFAHEATTFHAAPSPRRHATADYLLAHQGDSETIVVDVRPPKMFAAGHIPWAINIPWNLNRKDDMRFKSADDLTAHFASFGITPDRNIVLHCEVGLASAHSYVALRLLGFPRVRVYHRSWAEWGHDPALPKSLS